ncbi:MAG: hypothetical protein KAU29_01620, partial [Gammaproteobacteria bacterium]|nr:hypothetical protein [Gammaproteobacteria bacterium]
MGQQSFVNWVRQPASIILIIALVIMFLMLTDQSQLQEAMNPNGSKQTSTVLAPVVVPGAGLNIPSDMVANSPRVTGGELPKIVQRLGSPARGVAPAGAGAKPGRLTAPDLGSLLGRLEDKVKAEPNNVSNRL